jgi:hypothetical protein
MPPVGTTVDENGTSQLCPPWLGGRRAFWGRGSRTHPVLACHPSKEGISKEHCGT